MLLPWHATHPTGSGSLPLMSLVRFEFGEHTMGSCLRTSSGSLLVGSMISNGPLIVFGLSLLAMERVNHLFEPSRELSSTSSYSFCIRF